MEMPEGLTFKGHKYGRQKVPVQAETGREELESSPKQDNIRH